MSGDGAVNKLLVLYMPGLDARRLSRGHTPYLSGLLEAFPHATTTSYPSVEHLSTVITGMRPNEHGLWLVKRNPDFQRATPAQRLIDLLPDLVTTTIQSVAHRLTNRYQMCTVPPRRRRRMRFKKMKFYGRVGTRELLTELASHGVQGSLISAVGTDRARYVFTDQFQDREWLLGEVASGAYRLEVVQFHALDIMEHWYLDTPEDFHKYYGEIDVFIRKTHEKCQVNGVTMALVSDHGQERVAKFVDLKRQLGALEVPEDEYTPFFESMKARFWFHTDRARQAVLSFLSQSPDGTVVPYQEMRRYNVEFQNADYGEVYFVAHPGSVIFPDDFYQPVVNAYFGLKEWQKRKRLKRPILLGQHGYLPVHPSEQGLMAVLNRRFAADAKTIELRDVGPSVLGLLGEPTPSFMTGTSRFH